MNAAKSVACVSGCLSTSHIETSDVVHIIYHSSSEDFDQHCTLYMCTSEWQRTIRPACILHMYMYMYLSLVEPSVQ